MSIRWQIHQSATMWATSIADQLGAAVKDGGTLIVTGGTSPAPIYQALATKDLPWNAITLLLSDDRNVNDDHAQSNLRLVRDHLGQTGASIPALTQGEALAAAPYQAGLLGMGTDGHILSWFAGADGFDTAMTSDDLVCSINAANNPIAAPITDRISLTRKAVSLCKNWHIAIRGDGKRLVAKHAQEDTDRFPIGNLFALSDDVTITIHWCL